MKTLAPKGRIPLVDDMIVLVKASPFVYFASQLAQVINTNQPHIQRFQRRTMCACVCPQSLFKYYWR